MSDTKWLGIFQSYLLLGGVDYRTFLTNFAQIISEYSIFVEFYNLFKRS